ncbi:GGDEF domain-containing protein [bacterium]|nr:GGDEF domain-containing protein [bacterium]
MSRQQRSSRYFLEHLLPREALSPEERVRLDTVLRSGGADGERALALELAERLVARGVYAREAGGDYVFARAGERYRLVLRRALGAIPAPVDAERVAPAALPATAPLAAAADAVEPLPEPPLERLREVLAVLRLQGRQPGILSGLGRLLAALGRWHPGGSATVYHFEDLENGESQPGLVALEPDTLAAEHPFRRALAGGGLLALPGDAVGALAFPAASATLRAGHWLLLPLRLPSEDGSLPWGLLELRLPAGAFPASLPAELGLLGEALSELVHNHRVLAEVVYVDGLTQVYNRSFFDQQLPVEVERATRNNEPLAMLVVDLDDFKQINDRHGHEAGDGVLREFGGLLHRTLRRVDLVFRYGGEEFVVLLPRLDEESALRAAERLRLAVAEHPFPVLPKGGELRVTVSIGGALYPRDAVSERGLFREADAACYRSKRGGKNRVSFAPASGDAV